MMEVGQLSASSDPAQRGRGLARSRFSVPLVGAFLAKFDFRQTQ
jgi:hypothetical protein